jgi:hypothetical protein
MILGTKFDFVKYKAIFNKSPLDLYFTKIPTQIPFNKMWVQTNMSQISTNLHLGEYSPINSPLYRCTSKFLHIFKFVKPKQFSNLTPNPITIVVNISAKSKTNPNLQNPITTLVSKTAKFIFKSKTKIQ